MRTDIIRTKIVEIQESLDLISENLPDSFEEFIGTITEFIQKKNNL